MVDTRTAAEKAAAHKAQVEGDVAVAERPVAAKAAVKPPKEGSLAQRIAAEALEGSNLEAFEKKCGPILWYILRGVFTDASLEVLFTRVNTAVKVAAEKRKADKAAKPAIKVKGDIDTDEEVFDRYLSDEIIYATKSTNRP